MKRCVVSLNEHYNLGTHVLVMRVDVLEIGDDPDNPAIDREASKSFVVDLCETQEPCFLVNPDELVPKLQLLASTIREAADG